MKDSGFVWKKHLTVFLFYMFQLPKWLPLGEALCDVDPETREAAVQVLSQAEVDHVVADCLGASELLARSGRHVAAGRCATFFLGITKGKP